MKPFFENAIKLEKIRGLSVPSGTDLVNVLGIIKDDVELTLYFYDKLNPSWLELLEESHEFEGLDAEKGGLIERYKATYLFECAEVHPEAVLRIIKEVKVKDEWIRGKLADAIAKMPEQVAVKGVPIILSYIEPRERMVWFFAGEEAAKLMVKLIENYPGEAFEVAKALLDIWWPGKKEAGVFETIRSKFATHEYMEVMFKFYNKVWEKKPLEATRLLINIYDDYLEEYNRNKGYDTSEYLGIIVDDLDDIADLSYNIDAILMKGLCEAGKTAVKIDVERISELLDNLERHNKGIFIRIEMYLLRFVPAGTEIDRINKLLENQEYIESRLYWHEHRKLLNDKFDGVEQKAKDTFIEWIKKPKITDDRKKEVKEWCQKNNQKLPDFEKWENQRKAEELYLVREKFKELYEEYKKKSGVSDVGLAPQRIVGEAHAVSPEEGSPYSSEKMAKDSVDNILNYLSEPKNYEGKENVSGWGTAKEALAASFKADIKKRPLEYLNVDFKKLEGLNPGFLVELFYAVSESVRDGSFKKESWEKLIDLACGIVEEKNKQKEWRNCFLAILWVLNDGFGKDNIRITLNETIIKKLWFLFKELMRYNYDEKSESEEDPVQRRLRSVQGGAFDQAVFLGLMCKNNFALIFDNFLKKEMLPVYDFVAKEVKRSEVNCTFGSDFARIYWIDKEWVESNLEVIFNDTMWDAVWGTYVSWGRPSPECFKYLIKKGIYGQAVERIEQKNKYKFHKKPDNGLVEHLMIGYFNGWIGFKDDVLKKFFEKAPTELRGKAAEFLTTGFKSVNEKGGAEKEKVSVRMGKYWKNRLTMIKSNPKENEKEAIGLVGWVEDSVLPEKETLELLEQTLELSGGRIGEMRDAKSLVEGINKLGKGNELLALRCLKKAAEDKNMHYPWARIEDSIVEFLKELPKEVRNEGRDVADLYGRYNPDKFRGVWEKLNN